MPWPFHGRGVRNMNTNTDKLTINLKGHDNIYYKLNINVNYTTI